MAVLSRDLAMANDKEVIFYNSFLTEEERDVGKTFNYFQGKSL